MALPKEYCAKLLEVKNLSPSVKFFKFELEEEFEFVPGQFVMLKFEDVKRAYSIASCPMGRIIEFAITMVTDGKLTSKLDKMAEGDKVVISGPYAKFGQGITKIDNDIVFIATGSGVSPIRCLLQHLYKEKFQHKVTLVYGFRHEEDYLFKSELEELEAKWGNFNLVPTISRPKNPELWKEKVGRVTSILDPYVNNKIDFFICGLGDMVKEVRGILGSKGVVKEKIHVEAW